MWKNRGGIHCHRRNYRKTAQLHESELLKQKPKRNRLLCQQSRLLLFPTPHHPSSLLHIRPPLSIALSVQSSWVPEKVLLLWNHSTYGVWRKCWAVCLLLLLGMPPSLQCDVCSQNRTSLHDFLLFLPCSLRSGRTDLVLVPLSKDDEVFCWWLWKGDSHCDRNGVSGKISFSPFIRSSSRFPLWQPLPSYNRVEFCRTALLFL